MITKNFMMLVASILQSNGGSMTPGYLPVKDINGDLRYLGHVFSGFPRTVQIEVIKTAYNQGIHIGSGNTPPTVNDYNLESPITSGFTSETKSTTWGVDANDNVYLEMVFTITNTTNSDIVIREISYVASFYTASSKGGNVPTNGSGSKPCMIDRTVLDAPVTVPANGSADVKYTLKTIIPT